ncbi:MAG: 3-deoxy-manno-octulosonate cytidylyltransferase [Cytophagales bacterium]
MRVIGIIPARYASTRYPGKPLIDIAGKTMIQRVYEQAKKCSGFEKVIIATDDQRIQNEALRIGAEVIMTSEDHPSGTDRCFEAYEKSGFNGDFIINIQGDEPFIDPGQLEALIDILDPQKVELATLAKKITDPGRLIDANSVKVVFDKNWDAIYFSRHPIPFNRDEPEISNWLSHNDYFKHIGIYAYRSDVLKAICKLERSNLEISESLEQLRWIENGFKIKLAFTDLESPNIDSPADLEKLKNQGLI